MRKIFTQDRCIAFVRCVLWQPGFSCGSVSWALWYGV